MNPKKLVLIVAITLMVGSAASITLFLASQGTEKIIQQAIRFSLTCALSISLIRGWSPGRWIAIVLSCMAGVVGVLGGVGFLSASLIGPAVGMFLLGFVYAVCAAALLSPWAREHFQGKASVEQNA